MDNTTTQISSPVAPVPEVHSAPTASEEARAAALKEKKAKKRARLKEKRRRAILKRKSTRALLATGLFFLMILLFVLINLISKDKDYSDSENRSLSQRPAITLSALADGSWFEDYASYYSDQFVGRDSWMSLNLQKNRLLGQKQAGTVYLGEDDYLLREPETPDSEANDALVSAVSAFAAAYPDTAQYMMIVPEAATILTDKLPANAPVRDQLSDLSAITSRLPSSVTVIDTATPLQNHADEYIYYKTDHHWTSLGAKYLFEASASALNIESPASSYETYTVADDFEGTLASKSGCHDALDSVDIYVPQGTGVEYYTYYPSSGERVCSLYQSSCLDDKDKYTVFFGGNHPLIEIHTTADSGRNLLLFKDSYANCFVQFLVPYYDNIYMIDPRYYYDDLGPLMTSSGITDVMYLYCANSFVTDTNLADVLNAALEAPDDSTLDSGETIVDSGAEAASSNETEDTTDSSAEETEGAVAASTEEGSSFETEAA